MKGTALVGTLALAGSATAFLAPSVPRHMHSTQVSKAGGWGGVGVGRWGEAAAVHSGRNEAGHMYDTYVRRYICVFVCTFVYAHPNLKRTSNLSKIKSLSNKVHKMGVSEL